ncbi:hypothetical protein AHMF7605_12525 [Adhaeribacter arboris]|uniref:CYTH domain-containing protein n=1 Tax=Adhaeribacter arboris TaxID=2072846 RepID=A0A2T2YFI9_9BACT|nr:hypothetical protein [Adhaeribacter arboris]PSR54286.1 hypothetical protein AHMF7605_12525 [Adhaeribacter arboris]
MVYSSEIRWFFNALAEVSTIEKWFNAQQKFFSGQWGRADIYLRQADLRTHSVKIREGKVEVKVLLQDRGVVTIPSTNSGLGNDWVKYSFELKETDAENKALLEQFSQPLAETKENLWVRVEKERLLVKYSLNEANDTLSVTSEDAWPDEGCGVELTKIKVNQQEYYTFGLEAFSKTQREKQNLDQVLNYILPEINVTSLQSNQSDSYPGFLANLYKV